MRPFIFPRWFRCGRERAGEFLVRAGAQGLQTVAMLRRLGP